MTLLLNEIAALKQSFGTPTELWKLAFRIYNEDKGEKLQMNCRPYYGKVLMYHMEKRERPILE